MCMHNLEHEVFVEVRGQLVGTGSPIMLVLWMERRSSDLGTTAYPRNHLSGLLFLFLKSDLMYPSLASQLNM